MNRTANCIQMLILLKNKNIMSIEELAEKLNTNPRNIREYKKELTEAGYTIHSYRGQNGGYQLDHSARLILPQLSMEEIQDLIHVKEYLQANLSLRWGNAAQTLEKIIAQTNGDLGDQEWLFVYLNGKPISKKVSNMLYTIRKALANNNMLELDYQAIYSNTSKIRYVDPYALIFSDQCWYLLGYDHMRKEYRTYRVSEQRMHSVEPTFQYFKRDETFNITDHIGSRTLVEQEMVHYVVEINVNKRRNFLEIEWGENLIQLEKRHDNWECYAFDSDDEEEVFKQLYKLQDQIRLLEPEQNKQKYLKGLKDILENYN
ncbi:MAG: WYL domain-containing protein [Erysipelotrichaceae bacterium]|nr:WYL domain-containing protein [Erysipelotrichaceae bacterium]